MPNGIMFRAHRDDATNASWLEQRIFHNVSTPKDRHVSHIWGYDTCWCVGGGDRVPNETAAGAGALLLHHRSSRAP